MPGPDPIRRPEPGADAGYDAIQADIEETRRELGDTVEALQAKLDVKERAKEKVADTRERVVDVAHTAREAAAQDPAGRLIPVAVVLGVLTLLFVWRRRRR